MLVVKLTYSLVFFFFLTLEECFSFSFLCVLLRPSLHLSSNLRLAFHLFFLGGEGAPHTFP